MTRLAAAATRVMARTANGRSARARSPRARARLAALLGASLAPLAGCVAHLPEEAPRRIHALERRVEVRLVSEPPGLAVFSLGVTGAPDTRLGSTPLVLDELVLGKEIWKHGLARPVPGDGLSLDEEGDLRVRSVSGGALAYRVALERRPGGAAEPIRFLIEPLHFQRAFATGVLILDAGKPPASRD